jgi:hypothetical protein
MRNQTIGLALLLSALSGCCERQELTPGTVLLSEATEQALSRACRISDASTEQELVVRATTQYLQELHLKHGQQPQDCRLRRDQACNIVDVICEPNQTAPQAPPHCAALLDTYPDEVPRSVGPCGCNGPRRLRKDGWVNLDRRVLTMLDKIARDTHAAGREQALDNVIARAESFWKQHPPRVHPQLRAPGAPCPRTLPYERLMQRAPR